MITLGKILAGLALVATTSVYATNGADIYKSCVGCHGANGEKKALGKSEIIKGWEAKKVEEALNGYKNGSYGGAMKGVMKGQVARLDEKSIKAVSEYISNMK